MKNKNYNRFKYTFYFLLALFIKINAQNIPPDLEQLSTGKKYNQNALWMLQIANGMRSERTDRSTINSHADSLHYYMDFAGQASYLYRYHIIYSNLNGVRLPVEIRSKSDIPDEMGIVKLHYDQNQRIIKAYFFQSSGATDTVYAGHYENRFDSNGRLIFKYFDYIPEPGVHYIQGDSLSIQYDEMGRDSIYEFYKIINPPYNWNYIISADNFIYDSENNLSAIEFFNEENATNRERYSNMSWYGGYNNQLYDLFIFNEPTLETNLNIANDIIPKAIQKHRMEPIQYDHYFKDNGAWELVESRELTFLNDTLIECDLRRNGELIYKEQFRVQNNLLLQYEEFQYNSENGAWETSKQSINRYSDYELIEEVYEFIPAFHSTPQLEFSVSYQIDSDGNLQQFEYTDRDEVFRKGTYFYNSTGTSSNLMDDQIFTLSPNPSSNKVILNFQDQKTHSFSYKIITPEGRVVQSGNFHTFQRTEIDLEKLAPGFYFFQWKNELSKGIHKLIKL